MEAVGGVSIGDRFRMVRALTVSRGSASFDQAGDVGFDVFEDLPGKRSPFDGEYAAVRDGGLSGAAADQGRVQVAWSEERVGAAAELPVEVVEGDQMVTGGEDGVGTEVGS
jgi:hypothetical protein